MKRAMFTLIGLLFCVTAFAGETEVREVINTDKLLAFTVDETKTKYRVEIRIVYNEIDAKGVPDLVGMILAGHPEACEVHVDIDN